MNEYTDILEHSVNRLFRDISKDPTNADAWALVEELGIANLFLPEELGGMGGRWQDAAIIFRLSGYHAIPLPVGETMIARKLLHASLIDIPTGPINILNTTAGTLQCCKSSKSLTFTGSLTGPAAMLSGSHVLTVVQHGEDDVCVLLALALANQTEACGKIAGGTQAVYHFENATFSRITAPDAIRETLLKYGAYLRTSQIAGALIACLEKTVDYTRDRSQFGRQLRKFQAVQHQLALLTEEAAAITSASAAAAIALDKSDGTFEVSCAKLRANQAAGAVAGISHQLHGAIGITKEFGLYLHTQRLWAWRAEFGNNRYWAKMIGKHVLAHSDNSAWALITSRGI